MAELPMLEVGFPEANLQLPTPELATFYKNANDRIFWIDTEIDCGIFEIAKRIIQINKDDRDVPVENLVPIKLFINSPGGDLEATLSFINVCEISRTPIYTYNMGISMSGGLLILLAGHKRFCLDCSRAMYHIGSGSLSGTGGQIDSASKDYKRLLDYMKEYVMKHSTIDLKTLNKYKDADWYLSKDDQIKYGIVGSVVSSISDLM